MLELPIMIRAMDEVMRMIPLKLYLGELIEQGPTETIFTEPNDPRTKAYIEGAFG
jgi:phosphate transport system ATP-binding protein